MARFQKDGIDYFPLDVALDDKFALIEAEFGLKGFAVVIKLFQKIYGEQGYYCEWLPEIELLFSHKIGENRGFISAVVAAAVKRSIFDRDMYMRRRILTSHGIQRRYFDAASRRKEVAADGRYLLLSKSELPDNVYIFRKNDNIKSKNVDINPQSKVKNSTEKKSKEEESTQYRSCSQIVEDVVRLFEQTSPQLNSTLTDAARSNIIKAYNRGVNFKELFDRIEKSDFLSGRSGRWLCSLVWAVKKCNLDKIMRGNYDNGAVPPSRKQEYGQRKPSYSIEQIEAFDEFK
ncbi:MULTISPECIES: DUF4373 domain-containing protein [unclassified Ruminococcus]|uniref:DUF4373 domain-containing protein n=1 Tax=unclassified Ruminococcus TaxID=2608920 RepID=UPI002108AB60|nr:MULTISPECIES: DUF4373 domain-containing protein [unclassified Ruminococcus]MCQ4023175.1 DUF4373 domain-containing protein [Ruminococcus sp. zg-924]MCQ4115393.1 DUF4373 domain-containing protein [Ruminococcus sp. zg-921]